ncbi:MAG: hypothetical protein ACKVHE_06240 [Planctomycetales bacterium]|jgi:hypothetical protein
MKTETDDPIVDEVRAARDKHAAQFNYDIHEIFQNVRTQQQSSGRQYVRYPARPATAASPETPTI